MEKNWIIIDIKNGRALYGVGGKTLKFSSYQTAKEVADQLFENNDEFVIFDITGIIE